MAKLNAAAQKELRRISLNRRSKLEAAKTATDRISSPIAKYDQEGNLHCIICKTIVKSSSIWKVHINSQNHKRNVEKTKELKEDILKAKPSMTIAASPNKPKGILKHVDKSKTVPTATAPVKKDVEEVITAATIVPENVVKNEQESLPENFFDVAKNSEKEKEALDEEWLRFKKEIKEESHVSHVIEASDHDHVAHDRQLEEIDEQMQCWYKVKTMEEKKENILKRATQRQVTDEQSDNSSDDLEQIDEFPNWRCKKFQKVTFRK